MTGIYSAYSPLTMGKNSFPVDHGWAWVIAGGSLLYVIFIDWHFMCMDFIMHHSFNFLPFFIEIFIKNVLLKMYL